MKSVLVVCILAFLTQCQPPQQPVIGVYTQDIQDFNLIQNNLKQSLNQDTATYIAASYIKNIQMGGAQVIPLFYHYSYQQLEDILGKINGVFFPGGGGMSIANDTNWVNKAKYIVQHAIKQNQAGNNYPIWGTCLGYYLVMYCLSGETDYMKMVTRVTGEGGIIHPLIVKNTESKLLKKLNTAEYEAATQGNGIFYFYHNWSIMLSTFANYPVWNDMLRVIATSKTSYGAQFMSIVEGKQYPFYLTQFHAQKNAFEWQIPANRSYDSISAQQKFINQFINEARRNKNLFQNITQLNKKLIYNYQPIKIAPGGYFSQVYVFDQSGLPN